MNRSYDADLRKPIQKLRPIEKISLQTEQDNTNELLEILSGTTSTKAINKYVRGLQLEEVFKPLDSLTSRSKLKTRKTAINEITRNSVEKSESNRQYSLTFRSELSPRKFDCVSPKHTLKKKQKAPQINLEVTEDKSTNYDNATLHSNFNSLIGLNLTPHRTPQGLPEPSTSTNKKKVFDDFIAPIKPLPFASFDKVFSEIGLGGIKLPPISGFAKIE